MRRIWIFIWIFNIKNAWNKLYYVYIMFGFIFLSLLIYIYYHILIYKHFLSYLQLAVEFIFCLVLIEVLKQVNILKYFVGQLNLNLWLLNNWQLFIISDFMLVFNLILYAGLFKKRVFLLNLVWSFLPNFCCV